MTLLLDAGQVCARTPWPDLLDAISEVLSAGDGSSPDRHVHDIELPGGDTGSLLLMPSWLPGDVIGVKTVTYVPTNAGTGVPTINAAYLLFDGADGTLLATLDGEELTARRTAAISALAARHLSRHDAHRLLIVGTGQLAPRFAEAHAAVRPLDAIEIWGRDAHKATAVAGALAARGLPARSTTDLAAGVRAADIVSCVTGASDPLVHGTDLQPGAHLDLVGSFRADMRETDDDAIARSSLFVDTVAGAVLAGDLAQPIEAGVITTESIRADLRDLVTGDHPGRETDDEITTFKSAGFALADLAAARLAARDLRSA
ncbi:MAG: ornithine cyclodeaminase family protein [Ilumatobacter sp.]|nr:ornithine cyclodeaminase family protein [Ilumatobacter sp.]